jgi:cyclic beta-1,2-glucan synthetase
MYQAAIQALLGIRRTGNTLRIDPCVPRSWSEYSLVWRGGRSRYRVHVSNPDHVSHGVAHAQLDGVAVDPRAVPLVDDGADHELVVRLGVGATTAFGLPTDGRDARVHR